MLSAFLKTAFGHTISEGELQEQMGDVVAKVTELMATFQQMDIKLEEYVCLKVLHLFTQGESKIPAKIIIFMWVRSRNCGCLVTWFCYQLIAKPGNKTATVP